METKEEIIAKAKEAIIGYDKKNAQKAAEEALAADVSPIELIEEGFCTAMIKIGDKFDTGEVCLQHMIAASEAMSAGINVLKPLIEATGQNKSSTPIWKFRFQDVDIVINMEAVVDKTNEKVKLTL